MTAAQESTGPDWEGGRSVLAALARTGRQFSANDCRAELRDLGFGRYDTGALFLDAEQQQMIRQVGLERSTDRPTHGKRLSRWIGTQHGGLATLIPSEAIAVRRDRRGQFTRPSAPVAAQGPSLLDFTESPA